MSLHLEGGGMRVMGKVRLYTMSRQRACQRKNRRGVEGQKKWGGGGEHEEG